MKKCTKCGVEYELSEFPKDKKAKDKRKSHCKKCSYQTYLSWKSKNPDKLKVYNKNEYSKRRDSELQKTVEKRKNNVCKICGISLELKQSGAFYCDIHRHQTKLEYKRESYKRNIETVEKYNIENKEKIRTYQREKEQQRRDNFSDRYVVKILVEKDGFNRELINNDILETKRLILKTKRLCKTSKT